MTGYLERASVARALKAAIISKSPRWKEAGHLHDAAGDAALSPASVMSAAGRTDEAPDAIA